MKDRRSLGVNVILMLAFACMLFAQGCLQEARSDKASIEFDNAWFYNADGSFNVNRGKDAYIAVISEYATFHDNDGGKAFRSEDYFSPKDFVF